MSGKRLRRSPERARAEILEAAEAALQELEFNELTVEILMERTGMTRSSFYHYFASLEDVAIALFGRIEAELAGAVDAWLTGEAIEDPEAATVTHLTRMFEVWREHAILIRALEQAAGRNGVAYEQWRSRLVDRYIEMTARFIRKQVERGLSAARDPERLASALILMNTAVATDQLSRPDPDSAEEVGGTLAGVWNAAIYHAK